MIKVTIYQDANSQFTGFDCEDHADYADAGEDVVCAAVSALTITCMNSIEVLTQAEFTQDIDEANAMICFRLTSGGRDAQLLLHSMVLGLEEIESNYSEYIDVIFKEV